jgi:MoaA/NifB/PqqE/SkfB family radical SAM enzyme
MVLSENGDVSLCCPGRMPEPVGNFNKYSLAALWKGGAAQQAREGIYEGTFSHCGSCRFAVQRMQPVKPVTELTTLELAYAQRHVPPMPYVLNVSVDRSCQLSCPSCRTQQITASTAQDHIARKLMAKLLRDPDLKKIPYVQICGTGDPLFSKVSMDLIDALSDSRFGRMKITLLTNALLFSKAWNSWAATVRKRVCRVNVSVDAATPETYAVNRRGGKWGSLLPNLLHLGQLRAAGVLEHLRLKFVVQQNNWREMGTFVSLAESLSADNVFFMPLSNWGTYTTLDYNQRAVHRPEHPEHAALRAYMDSVAFRRPNVIQQLWPDARQRTPDDVLVALG